MDQLGEKQNYYNTDIQEFVSLLTRIQDVYLQPMLS
jgi:hypothetical protein